MMKKIRLFGLALIVAILCSAITMLGQEPTEQWVARYYGPGYCFDEANATAVDSSTGNIYVTGQSGGDYATVAYNSSGNVMWSVLYDGPASSVDEANAIAVDPRTGNVYVTGHSQGDYTTVAYDRTGNQLWAARYNGPGNSTDVADAIAVDFGTGAVYVTGHSRGEKYDYATVAYDANGNQLWAARYNGPDNWHDEACAVAVDPAAGSIYVTGYCWASSCDYATVAYDRSGNQLWAVRHDGPRGDMDKAYALAVDPSSGNVYVTGQSWGASCDYATVAYNRSGTLLWVAEYDGPANSTDSATSIAVDPSSGNVLVTGSSRNTFNDYATVAYNSSGNFLWAARYNGPAGLHDAATDIRVDHSTGKIFVTGYSLGANNDYATVAYSSSGGELWAARYDGPESGYDVANALAVDPSAGAVYVTGRSGGNGTGSDYATVKYGGEVDPSAQLMSLLSQVESLVDSGLLTTNRAAPLLTKLKRVLEKLQKGKVNPACNQLEAFINQVKAYVRSGKLTEEQGKPLIDAAQGIIAALLE
jgi:hypothetical protein